MAGDEHRLGLGARLVEHLDERDAVAAGQLQIRQHEVERVGAEALQRRFRRQRDGRLVPLEVEQLLERLCQSFVVVNDQNLRRHLVWSSAPRSKQVVCQGTEQALDKSKRPSMHNFPGFVNASRQTLL